MEKKRIEERREKKNGSIIGTFTASAIFIGFYSIYDFLKYTSKRSNGKKEKKTEYLMQQLH